MVPDRDVPALWPTPTHREVTRWMKTLKRPLTDDPLGTMTGGKRARAARLSRLFDAPPLRPEPRRRKMMS